MAKIRVLPDTLANQIAAGEVVERPGAALKELLENSLDAGATQIDVDVAGGGIKRLRVADNGAGIDREDLALAVARHATSKISSDEDLSEVRSYGFRGEALPSIASVSRFTLTTSDGSSPEALRLLVEYGAPASEEPAAHPRGTDVLVEGLFAHTPARRKFLKAMQTTVVAGDRGGRQ